MISLTYVGYPSLERIAFRREDPRLKPSWLLRFWYLAQELEQEAGASYRREALFAAWAPLGWKRNALRYALSKGEGLYWEKEGTRNVRLYAPAEVHAREGLVLVRRVRPLGPLLDTAEAWHRSLVEDAVHCYQRFEGKTDPITHARIAQRTGRSRTNVRKHVYQSRKLRRIPQFVTLEGEPTPGNLRRAREVERPYVRVLPEDQALGQQIANRYEPTGRVLDPGEEETPQGKLLRNETQLLRPESPKWGDLWDGKPLHKQPDDC